jgi:hypothetical protein
MRMRLFAGGPNKVSTKDAQRDPQGPARRRPSLALARMALWFVVTTVACSASTPEGLFDDTADKTLRGVDGGPSGASDPGHEPDYSFGRGQEPDFSGGLDGSTSCGVGCQDGESVSKVVVCGDGTLGPGEQCDFGASNQTSAGAYGVGVCTTGCSFAPYCGDGRVQASFGEECDGTSQCTPSCKVFVPKLGLAAGGPGARNGWGRIPSGNVTARTRAFARGSPWAKSRLRRVVCSGARCCAKLGHGNAVATA